MNQKNLLLMRHKDQNENVGNNTVVQDDVELKDKKTCEIERKTTDKIQNNQTIEIKNGLRTVTHDDDRNIGEEIKKNKAGVKKMIPSGVEGKTIKEDSILNEQDIHQ